MAVASAGGHWVQLMRLRPSWKDLDVTYVTTDPGLLYVLQKEANELGEPPPKFKTVVEANRWQKLKLLKQLTQLAFILLIQRPDVVITTGAAPGYFALRLGKLFGAKTIWIDSLANAETLSLSGQKIAKYADLWLTQWKHLAKEDGPSFLGAVL